MDLKGPKSIGIFRRRLQDVTTRRPRQTARQRSPESTGSAWMAAQLPSEQAKPEQHGAPTPHGCASALQRETEESPRREVGNAQRPDSQIKPEQQSAVEPQCCSVIWQVGAGAGEPPQPMANSRMPNQLARMIFTGGILPARRRAQIRVSCSCNRPLARRAAAAFGSFWPRATFSFP